MDSATSRLEARITRLRPVLLTLAEALISPALRVELDASDLVQQTLMEAHQQSEALASFDDGSFFGWLRKALRHNVLDAVKHLSTQKNNAARRVRAADIDDSFVRLEELLVADDTSPSEILQRNEQTARLLAAIQELPRNQREAVILKHLRGCSLRQLAEELGLSETATAGLLHRGRKQLVERLEHCGDA
ncbi:ECF RNA polymerase sigma factor SigE [Stieleria bergensis]|uniref:ECF RNA polymerase sigma factor SigE n=1 Tax=Stieleria bergensis TaxID=2528025 RepID=A0A517SVE8_9BACT|nr:ECF RNA polymerase sigma factor SigE [Planctomycetes bacterium SV_7m_r]